MSEKGVNADYYFLRKHRIAAKTALKMLAMAYNNDKDRKD